MVYVFLGIVVIIALVVAYGIYKRRQIYKSVDELDQRKDKALNEPVADEISRVKGLTISGETEEKFEKWREAWDELVEDRLPEIEMYLLDIEDTANKYQFRRAKEKIAAAKEHMDSIEKEISAIRQEVDQLINSEEKNREEIDTVTQAYKDVRALLSRQWQALDEAGPALEKELDNCQEELEAYHSEMETGNYMSARERLLALQETLERLQTQITKVPQLLVDIDVDIPERSKELRQGLQEMREQGFSFVHYKVQEDLNEIESELELLKKGVSELMLDDVSEQVEQNKETIEQIYDSLEEEVEAKQWVEKQISQIHNRHAQLDDLLETLAEERSRIEESYQLPEEDKNLHEDVEKELEEVDKDRRVFKDLHTHRKQSFVDLRKMLENLGDRMDATEEKIRRSLERLQELRGEETRAIEQLKDLRTWLMETQLKLQKSQLPAVPEILIEQLDDARKELEKATALLEMTPLEMTRVHDALQQSHHQVEKASHTLNETMDRSEWAERLLQFGNRYRTEYTELIPVLNDAEWQFRNGYYEDSIQNTSKAFQRLVPYAFSSLEEEWYNQSEQQTVKT
ncbi:septation ring formation regulator [Geomicrobium halophilum]|uniref:Septation ring formation regulator n=1 Tax=Geomicrobium halophilum TaxID=549000 RepID=A0A841PWD7_9BACL|nr:septation ring formation regulator EzrA [Geomicrobium halophilum]MBB6448145.1 septation ring formation regulator [Geomicrobium halophilum]